MKKIILIILSIFISNFVLSQSQWDNYSVTGDNNLIINDVKFVDANTGYSISYDESFNCNFHKTTNGGENI